MGQKGGGYEREICRTLTKWWTGDPDRDVIFWRTSQSGGRATFRKKKGKSTSKAHLGDITAIEKEGLPLTELVTIEIKRGYAQAEISSLLDKPLKGKFGRPPAQQKLEAFLEQTIEAASDKKTPYWMLIHRRDGRQPLVYIDSILAFRLDGLGCLGEVEKVAADVFIRSSQPGKLIKVEMVVMTLDDFTGNVDPEDVRTIHRRLS